MGLLEAAASVRQRMENLRREYGRQANDCEERRRRRRRIPREEARATVSAGFTIFDARPVGGAWIWDPVTQRWYPLPGR